ncbi:hypothetical protein [Flavobacterium sp. ALJ2]|uniref:hypothetical protein n=1 Tax=Flavobacterium sp. ALJ2 TaxID=2786960 RepID=UPI001E4AA6E1|nr:hypothetical protein [Flavobacterium sp. ALJ2]
MKKFSVTILLSTLSIIYSSAQTINYDGKEFELSNVIATTTFLNGEKVLKVERDLTKVPFNINHLEKTVDEPTFLKLKNVEFENGIIEIKVLSQLQDPLPFKFSKGFIGLAFRVNKDNSSYQSIYLRPKAGRSENQLERNHTVQYYAYPNYKFAKLRKEEYKGQYETYANIDLNEWITIKIEIKDKKAILYLNEQKHPSFIVNEMLGDFNGNGIGLWVDVGTIGYFKDLKIIKTK